MSRSTTLGILAAAIGLACVVGAAEIGLWFLVPVPDPYQPPATQSAGDGVLRMEYPRDYAARIVVSETLPGLGGEGSFTTNSYGFRGGALAMPKAATEFRVFLVGGSTVECFYIDDGDELGAVIERRLSIHAAPDAAIHLYNVGLSGAASDDHISMIAQRLIHLEPDLIVVMCGINDLLRSMRGFDYLHYPRPVRKIAWWRFCARFQIGRRLIYLKQRVQPEPRRLQEARTLTSRYGRLVKLQQATPETEAPPLTNIAPYRHNLETIAGIARSHRVGLVFVTHPHTWNSQTDPEIAKYHWMRLIGESTYNEVLMDAAMESMNLTMIEVARDHAIPLYDLVTDIEKSTDFFYDDCHFNTNGVREAASGLSDFLRENRLVPVAAP